MKSFGGGTGAIEVEVVVSRVVVVITVVVFKMQSAMS
jgi:hypothetical protein